MVRDLRRHPHGKLAVAGIQCANATRPSIGTAATRWLTMRSSTTKSASRKAASGSPARSGIVYARWCELLVHERRALRRLEHIDDDRQLVIAHFDRFGRVARGVRRIGNDDGDRFPAKRLHRWPRDSAFGVFLPAGPGANGSPPLKPFF